MNEKVFLSLIKEAKKARTQAYAPYSKFKVGAAVLAQNGKIYTGCNVENASYGLTVCAERNAIGKMAADGQREILAVAVIADLPRPVTPCGACRQVISEFGADAKIVMANMKGAVLVENLQHLLPFRFSKKIKK